MPRITEHLAHLRILGMRPGTIYQRRTTLRRAERALGPLLETTPERVYAYVAGLPIGPESRAAHISHLRGFFRWAMVEGYVDVDLSARLERPRRPRHLPRPMPQAELRRALQAADEPIRAWLHLAAYAGLRSCEIAPIRGEDRDGDTLRIREQKGGDEGAVTVGPLLDQALGGYPLKGWWFPRRDGQEGPISAGQLQRYANRFLHDLGIDSTMHSLRHRFISDVYQASGRDLRVTQELARHRSVVSTQGYTYIDPGDARAIVHRIG